MDSMTLANVENMIFIIRGHKVMLDADLAELYQVETKALKRAVRRNKDRFPDDFMFELTKKEMENLRYQIGTSRQDSWGGLRYMPFAFTQEGVAMLSGVLNSNRATRVNITIMRTFVKLRQLLLQESLSDRVTKLEKETDQVFRVIFQRLDTLELTVPILPPNRRKIGIAEN